MADNITEVLETSTRSGFFLTLGHIFSTIISAITGFVLARLLGPELYGLYAIPMIIPSVLLLLIVPGLRQSVMKFSASLRTEEKPHQLKRLLIHSLIFQTILALIAFLICFVFSTQLSTYVLNRPDIAVYVQILSPLILFNALSELLGSMFNGLDKTEYNALRISIQQITRFLLSPTLLLLGLGITGALSGNVLSWFIAFGIGGFYFIKVYNSMQSSNRQENPTFVDSLTILLRYGLPIYLTNLIAGFIPQFTNILLAIFTSNYDVGNYSAAHNVSLFINSITLAISGTLLPAFAKLEKREEESKDFLRISIKYISIIILPIIVLIMLNSKELIYILYGERYELAPQFLLLDISKFFLVGFGYIILTSYFNGIGETKINFKVEVIVGITTFILAPILSWYFGAIGIVITLVVTKIFETGIKLYIARTKFKIQQDYNTISRILVVSLVSAIIIPFIQMIFPQSIILRALLGSIVYLGLYLTLLPLAKVVSRAELTTIRSITNRIKLLNYVARYIISYEEKILNIL